MYTVNRCDYSDLLSRNSHVILQFLAGTEDGNTMGLCRTFLDLGITSLSPLAGTDLERAESRSSMT